MTTLDIVRQWFTKAGHDLTNAEHTLKMKKGCPFDTICFHAQQAVKKTIKALLTHHKIPFPKSHDIGELVKLLPPSIKVSVTVDEQELLSDYAIAGRYPGETESLERKEAEQSVKMAKRVMGEIEKLIFTK